MDKPFNKDNMDAFFRQAFDGLGDAPAEDGWDLPSDGVWAGVQRALAEEQRSRKAPFWLWFGATALCGLLLTLLLFVWSNNRGLQRKAVEQALAAERLQLAVDSLTRELSLQGQAVMPLQEAERKAPHQAVKESPSTLPSGKASNQALREGVAPRLSALAVPPVRITAGESMASPALPLSLSGFRPVSASDTSLASAGPPSGITHGMPLLSPLPASSLGPLALPVYPLHAAYVPAEQAGKKAVFYLGAYSALNYTSRDLLNKPSPGITARPIFETLERGRESLEFGLKAGLQLSPRWALESGIGAFSIRQQSRQLFRITYDPELEQTADDGSLESTYALAIPSAYGDSQIEVDIRRDASQRVLPGETIGLEAQSRQQLRFISLPLLARYELPVGRFSFGAKAGLALNLLQATSLQTAVQVRRNGLRAAASRTRHRFSEVRDTNLDYLLGLSAHYRVLPGLDVALEPTFRKNLRPFNEAQYFNTRFYALGFQLGLNYHL
ncbi:MAG: hypothetical protein H6564_16800 [Lewinellaceae bacterium]|nr:hypothetical protein [Lewinellaceae bacterium]